MTTSVAGPPRYKVLSVQNLPIRDVIQEVKGHYWSVPFPNIFVLFSRSNRPVWSLLPTLSLRDKTRQDNVLFGVLYNPIERYSIQEGGGGGMGLWEEGEEGY